MAPSKGKSMQPLATTSYGTTSLVSDQEDTLAATSQRRRNTMLWGATVGTIGAGIALIIYGYTHHVSTDSIAARTARGTNTNPNTLPQPLVTGLEGTSLDCWQSATINGETHMMESISGLQWTKLDSNSNTRSKSFIKVDSSQMYQEIYGFGGAFTEAAALQFHKLPLEKQEEVLKLYFDKEHGSAYSFGRVPMGSCDFSVESYNFDPVVNDTELIHFDTNVTQDTTVLIPFIQRAIQKNPELKLFFAPWSPPGWMKEAPHSMLGSAQPNGLHPSFRKTWALYFSKFITAYKNHNITFWGMTPQNEPEFAAPWEACVYNASYEADFIGDFLGPILKRDHPDVKILVFDHNRAGVAKWANIMYHHPTAKQYIDGMAFHWYDDQRYMDGVAFHDHLNDTHFIDPSRFILATESCNCPGVANGTEAWFRAQRYAHDIITDMNNWVVGWVDWNLLLDHRGGPNHLGNECDAPIILDPTEKDYTIQPMYYFIQHFSKYIPVGSHRIGIQNAATFTSPGDAQLYTSYPVKMHTCDGSSRQHLIFTSDNKLQINGTEFCIDLVRPEWEGHQVELVKCMYTSQSWTFTNNQIRMKNNCLQLNHGSVEDGVRVVTGKCIEQEGKGDHQKWTLLHPGGRLHSILSTASDLCVTAGYSFVQAAAFLTPENKKVAIVLNENTEPSTFQLQYGDVYTEMTLLPGAIRTLVWE